MSNLHQDFYKNVAAYFNLSEEELKKQKDICNYIARMKTVPRKEVKQICLSLLIKENNHGYDPITK